MGTDEATVAVGKIEEGVETMDEADEAVFDEDAAAVAVLDGDVELALAFVAAEVEAAVGVGVAFGVDEGAAEVFSSDPSSVV